MKRIPPFHLVGKRFYDPNAPPYKAVFLITTDFIWRILLCMKICLLLSSDKVFTILMKGSFVCIINGFEHLNFTTNGCSFLFT